MQRVFRGFRCGSQISVEPPGVAMDQWCFNAVFQAEITEIWSSVGSHYSLTHCVYARFFISFKTLVIVMKCHES